MALQLLLFALVLLCGRMDHADASLSPRVYWKTLLPNTPMPPIVRDFFYPPAAAGELQDKTSLLDSTAKSEEATFMYSATKPQELGDKVTLIYSDNKPHELQDEVSLIYSDTKPHELQDEVSLIYSNTKLDEATFIHSDTKSHELRDEVWLIYSDTKPDEVSLIYSDTKPHELQDEVSLIYSDTKPHELRDKAAAIAAHRFQDKVTRSPFFLEKDLFPGANLTMQITNNAPSLDLLPRRVAGAFPFSSAKLREVLALLSIDPNSEEAKRMRRTLQACEAPTIAGETKFCATSLESMVDFAVSLLGTNDVQALSTMTTLARGAESPVQPYTVSGRFRKIGDIGSPSVVCHPMNYAYAVFACHALGPSAREYAVTMTGSVDATQVEMVAMCHTDTSAWNPRHLAFQVLGVKPGTETICHLLTPGNILWIPNDPNRQ